MENETIDNPPTIQHPVLIALNEKVEALTKQNESLQSTKDYYLTLANDRFNTIEKMRESVKEFLVDNIDNVDVDEAKSLADNIGIEITKTYTVSGTITWSGRVELSIFEDIDDVNSIRYGSDVSLEVSLEGEEVSNIDYDLEDLTIEDY